MTNKKEDVMIFNIAYLVTFKEDIRTSDDKPTLLRSFDVPLDKVEKDIEEHRDEWTLLNVELTLQHHHL
tara:strand:+ start:25 stop:231 length:207 start_codon:yes stop_codon:yes gene_type:complete